MNAFLIPPTGDANKSLPERVYACLDSAEQIAPVDGDILTVWDAIDADWYDENHRRLNKAELLDQVPIYRFEMLFNTLLTDVRALRQMVRQALEPGYDDALRWFKIEFGPEPVETTSTFYSSLLGVGSTRFIQRTTNPTAARQNQLTQSFSLDDVTEASNLEVEDFLEGLGQIDHIVAYDVGQGVSIGLCDAAGAVRAYADAGAGSLANTKTFPSTLTSFCFGESPGVILSHWDTDHWAAAVIDSRFKRQAWLAPYQKTRPSHRAMAQEIIKHGRLLIWPSGTTSLAKGQIQIEKCTGKGRNGTGLAVTAWRDTTRTTDPVLIPGDADYHLISSFGTVGSYFAAMIPHHGGRLSSPGVPTPVGGVHSRAIYSYGAGNTYKHPDSKTQVAHHHAGWTNTCVAPRATPELCRRTADRCPASGLGHALVAWAHLSPLPGTACAGSACQLAATQ